MKPLILPLLLVIATAAKLPGDEGPYREFADDQGRSMRAVIVSSTAENAWIRRDDGRTFRVPVSTFSQVDRAFISQWRQLEALKNPNAIEFTIKRYSDGREVETTQTRRFETEDYGYVVTVTNNTSFDLEDLDIEYRHFALRGSTGVTGQDRELERHTGRTRIASLKARQDAEFRTPALSLRSISLRSNRTADQRRINDDLGGIWIRITRDREIIAEVSSPSRLKNNERW